MAYVALGLFLGLLVCFHTSEAALAYIYDRSNFGIKSCLLSMPYCLAMAGAVLEYYIEATIFPGLEHTSIICLGFVVALAGDALRKTAMITAGSNFTHMIVLRRRPEHRLVTTGVYGLMRHPGYAGWALWALGTQIVMCNPISFVLFAVVVWHFFASRIVTEDRLLSQFFGSEYLEYRRHVPSGIPGVP